MARDKAFNPYTCPNCNAFYQLVKVEAGPETGDREITCRACGVPLVGREGKFERALHLSDLADGPKHSRTDIGLCGLGLSERLQKSSQVRSLFVAQPNGDRDLFAINSNL